MGTASEKPDKIVPPFDHKDTKNSRAQKWDTWSQLFISGISSTFPFLASQLLVEPDPDEDLWGIELDEVWFPQDKATDRRNSAQSYATAQATIYSTLLKNFANVEKKILEECSQPVLKAKIQAEHKLDPDDPLLVYLPFGNLAFHKIANKYKEKGVTQSITRLQRFEDAKEFDPKNVENWASKLQNAWSEVTQTAHDRDHIAALQTLMRILSSGHQDWRNWATQFSIKQGDQPYTVADLADAVLAQHQILTKTITAAPEQALYAGGTSGTPGGKKPFGKPRGNKKGKDKQQKKKCVTPGCSNFPTQRRHDYCVSCYTKQKDDQASVPESTRNANIDKRIAKAQKTLAFYQRQKKNNRQNTEEEAHIAVAENDDLLSDDFYSGSDGAATGAEAFVSSTSAPEDHDSVKPVKKKKKKVFGPAPPIKKKKKVILSVPGTRVLPKALPSSAKAKQKKKRTLQSEAALVADDAFSELQGCTMAHFCGSVARKQPM